MNRCIHGADFISAQRNQLEGVITVTRYRLSDKRGYEVSQEAATTDFLDRFVDAFDSAFQAKYCGHDCPDRQQCAIRHPPALKSA